MKNVDLEKPTLCIAD